METVFSDHYVVECDAVYKQGTDSKSGVNIPTNTGIGPGFDLLNFFNEFLLSHLTKCSIDLSR